MKVQSTNFTEVVFLLWEREIEHKYNYEKDTDLNHMLGSARPRYLQQKLCRCW